jgi:hypothetical protein
MSDNVCKLLQIKELIMNFLEVIKTLAEVITSFAAAFVIIANLLNYCNPVVKRFFKTTVPLFFIGYKNLDGKKTRFFKGLKLQHEQNAAITKAISQNFEMEEVLVLNKKALLDILSKSDVFEKIYRRKE